MLLKINSINPPIFIIYEFVLILSYIIRIAKHGKSSKTRVFSYQILLKINSINPPIFTIYEFVLILSYIIRIAKRGKSSKTFEYFHIKFY